MSNTATQKQIDFMARIAAERRVISERAAEQVENALTAARKAWRDGEFDKALASETIDFLLALPKAETPAHTSTSTEEVPEGMHVFHGTTYKVQVAKNGSGRRYAKALEQHDGRWIFVYAPGVIRDLSEATCMSAEEAAQFGALYGICCNCARDLTDERSIAAGYGPVCAVNNGWPWG